MARPLSMDLRERVVALIRAGHSCREAAARFGVSVASAVRWAARERATGTPAAKTMGGRVMKLLPHRAWLVARLTGKRVPLQQLRAELADQGIHVSYGALWAFVHRDGWSFRRRWSGTPPSRTAKTSRGGAQRRAHQGKVDPTRLVFIDETWTKTNRARRYGWGPKGTRLIEKAPQGRWRPLTFIAALRWDRLDAPCVINGPINGQLFTADVQQLLVPTLHAGDIVILDTLGSHKGKAVRRAIRGAGAKLFFLPPYSPDLQPIDQRFAKFQHMLRNAAVRTVDALWKKIGALLDSFTPDECANYLRNSGYASA